MEHDLTPRKRGPKITGTMTWAEYESLRIELRKQSYYRTRDRARVARGLEPLGPAPINTGGRPPKNRPTDEDPK